MKKGIIITLPRYDDVTEYFSQFSKEILKEAEIDGVAAKQLIGEDATKDVFESFLSKLNYKLIIMNGHGNAKEILGQDKKCIIAEGVNEHLLAGRITYARACEAGASLGKSVVALDKEGCFIGYDLPFQFFADITRTGNPLKDNTARIFLEPSNAVPISLINGKSAIGAHECSKKMVLKNINRVLRNMNSESLAVATALWNNYEGQVLHGNSDARIEEANNII